MRTALTTTVCALIGIMFFSLHPAWAVPSLFDFESGCGSNPAPLDCQEIISGPGVFSDVEFNRGSRARKLRDVPIISTFGAPGPEFSPSRSAKSPDPYFSGEKAYRADFKETDVNFVSVVLGDAGGDRDGLYIKAYSQKGELLDYDRKVLNPGEARGYTLSVKGNGSDIAYVVFGSKGQFRNSVSFDNFMYDRKTAIPNPEPTSLALMGSGLLGLMTWRMKRKGTNR